MGDPDTKFEGTKEIKDFRLISMMGCVYKVVAKAPARKIRKVMGGLMGEVQMAFAQDRRILDRALIVCESVH